MTDELFEVEHTWTTDVGYPAVCVRTGDPYIGIHRCGYVRIPEDHPWYGVHYNNLEPCPDVHGGITFSEEISFAEGPPAWWIGFDCAHLGDAREPWPEVTTLAAHRPISRLLDNGVVRNLYYVMQECEKLAIQVAEHGHNARKGADDD